MSYQIKKAFSVVLCLVLLAVFTLPVGAEESETAIPISTKEEFNNIRNNLSGDYYLTCDIEFTPEDFLSGGAFYNSGKGFVPIGTGRAPFTGTFDGRGHTISGLKISVSGLVYSILTTPIATASTYSTRASDGWTDDYIIDTPPKPTVSPGVGLFGASNGSITNLTLADSQITASSTNSAVMYVGGIVGHNKGTVSLCAVKNTVSGYSNAYVGGVVGYQSDGRISNCYARGTVANGKEVGGICGAVAGGVVLSAYSIFGNVATFGIVGTDVAQSLASCYYVSDEELDGIGTLVETENAVDKEKFIGFDFENVWSISSRLSLPVLKGFALPEGIDALLGDTNRDNVIDLQDVVCLAQYVAGWEVNDVEAVANVNRDFDENMKDIIDLTDVVYLAQNVAGWDGVELVW